MKTLARIARAGAGVAVLFAALGAAVRGPLVYPALGAAAAIALACTAEWAKRTSQATPSPDEPNHDKDTTP